MGFQEVKKLLNNQHRRHDARVLEVEDRSQDDGAKVWVLGMSGIGGIALPLQQLKPVKIGGRRRHDADEERDGGGEEGEEQLPVTPRGEGCRIPAEAETCPPAPKKPRTAVSILRSGAGRRRCNCDDGEVLRARRVLPRAGGFGGRLCQPSCSHCQGELAACADDRPCCARFSVVVLEFIKR